MARKFILEISGASLKRPMPSGMRSPGLVSWISSSCVMRYIGSLEDYKFRRNSDSINSLSNNPIGLSSFWTIFIEYAIFALYDYSINHVAMFLTFFVCPYLRRKVLHLRMWREARGSYMLRPPGLSYELCLPLVSCLFVCSAPSGQQFGINNEGGATLMRWTAIN